MAFFIKNPKPRRVRKTNYPNDEALRKLRAFLEAEEPQTVEFLMRFWQGQQNAISYAEIKEMIAGTSIGTAQFQRWQQDYAALVNSHFAPQWQRAMQAAAEERRRQFPHFFYDPAMEAAQTYIRERGAELVTMLSNTQQNAIRQMAAQAAHYDAITADRLARMIRPCMGLTAPQAQANLRYWNAVWLNGVEAGLSGRAAEKRADKMAATYAARQHRYRAMSIARTELAFAYNEGAYGATLAAQEQGYLGDTVKVWLTAADERVCDKCGPLDEVRVNMNAFFPGGLKMPPAHPQCRCAVAFEEVAESLQPGMESSIIGENTWAFVSGLDEQQKIKFFGGKTKAALFDAGMLAPEDYFKPLRDIDLGGVLLPDHACMRHVMVGDYILPSRNFPNGRLGGGGHTVHAMNEMSRLGITYNVTSTKPNGVMFGNVPSSPDKWKKSKEGQTWFPSEWTEYDIYSAGIAAANRGSNVHGYGKELVHKGVNVRILITDGRVSTIAPSRDQ